MSDNYDDDGFFWILNGEGIGILLAVLIFPIVPAGDLGLIFADSFGDNTPLIVYILSWLIFSIGYGAFLIYGVGAYLLDGVPTFFRVVIYYVQGIFFSYAVAATGNGRVTEVLVKIFNLMGGALFSPVS